MKKQILIITALSLLTVAACKKDNSDIEPLPQEQPALLASTKQTVSGGQAYNLTKEFLYDAQNRLKELKSINIGDPVVTEKYIYAGNKVQYRYFNDATEVAAAAADFLLNGNGRVDTTVYLSSASARRTHEYNNSGFITRINFLQNGVNTGYHVYHYNAATVLDSLSVFNGNGSRSSVNVYTYVAGKNSSTVDDNTGLQIFGKKQTSPVKKRTMFYYNLPGMQGIRFKNAEIDYTYEYDNNNRIKKHSAVETQYNPNGTSQYFIKEVIEYMYK